MRIAVDTGGTFTDCVYLREGKIHVLKVFSTPSNPADAIIGALRKIVKAGGQTSSKQIPSARNDKHEVLEVRHGTTVGTNTLLERKGARVAFVTTAGFEDTIAIGRQARPAVEALQFEPGDIAILNDPYAGGTHLPDITMVLPVYVRKSKSPAFYVASPSRITKPRPAGWGRGPGWTACRACTPT